MHSRNAFETVDIHDIRQQRTGGYGFLHYKTARAQGECQPLCIGREAVNRLFLLNYTSDRPILEHLDKEQPFNLRSVPPESGIPAKV